MNYQLKILQLMGELFDFKYFFKKYSKIVGNIFLFLFVCMLNGQNSRDIILIIFELILRAMSLKPNDDQLRQAIDAIFNKYDTDKSGTLEGN
jgi:hypothetical protein